MSRRRQRSHRGAHVVDDGDLYGRRSYDGLPGAGPSLRLTALGFLGGLTIGAVLWSRQLHRHRRGLFSPFPLRRLAALGYLGGQQTVDTARLLRDYIRWEPRPVLRRRGQHVLRQVEQYLDE